MKTQQYNQLDIIIGKNYYLTLKYLGVALCVEMGFMWTFPSNQDATVKIKSELISIKF